MLEPLKRQLNTYYLILGLAILCLSFKIKEINEEAIRPFYYVGFALCISLWFRNIVVSGIIQRVWAHNLSRFSIFVIVTIAFFCAWTCLNSLRFNYRSLKGCLYLLGALTVILPTFFPASLKPREKAVSLNFDNYCRLLGVVGVFSCAFAIFQLTDSLRTPWPLVNLFTENRGSFSTRLRGIQGEPTQFSQLCGLAFLAMLCLYQRTKNQFLAFVQLLFLTCAIFAKSKGTLLAIAISSGLFSSFFLRKGFLTHILLAAAGFTSIVLFAKLNFFLHFFRITTDVESFITRFKALKVFAQQLPGAQWTTLLFGGGMGYSRQFFKVALFNSYLSATLDFGLIFLIFLVLLIAFALLSPKQDEVTRLLKVQFSFSLTSLMFIDSLWSEFFDFSQINFWDCLLLLLGGRRKVLCEDT